MHLPQVTLCFRINFGLRLDVRWLSTVEETLIRLSRTEVKCQGQISRVLLYKVDVRHSPFKESASIVRVKYWLEERIIKTLHRIMRSPYLS